MAEWKHTSSSPLLQPGQTVTGLWYQKKYRVEQRVGHGAIGEVYRVAGEDGRHYALKVSLQSSEIALEHNMLQTLQEVARGVDLGPLVYDLDDVRTMRGKAFFYVMEWVDGLDLHTFLQNRGSHWTPVLLLQLCTYVERLHQNGRCFGDLKAENCLVDEHRGVLRLVDFGGVTQFGRGVKEYTEWYDRAWWGRGSRMAEESYDLFALTMIAVCLLAPDLRQKIVAAGCPNFSFIQHAVANDPRFTGGWRGVLQGVWSGRIRKIDGLRQELTPLLKNSVELEKRKRAPSKRKRRDWSDWLLYGSALVLILVFCQFLVRF